MYYMLGILKWRFGDGIRIAVVDDTVAFLVHISIKSIVMQNETKFLSITFSTALSSSHVVIIVRFVDEISIDLFIRRHANVTSIELCISAVFNLERVGQLLLKARRMILKHTK